MLVILRTLRTVKISSLQLGSELNLNRWYPVTSFHGHFVPSFSYTSFHLRVTSFQKIVTSFQGEAKQVSLTKEKAGNTPEKKCTMFEFFLIKGFCAKRAQVFLVKSELCRKRSKFRAWFSLGVLNINVNFEFSEKSVGNKSLIASFTFGTKWLFGGMNHCHRNDVQLRKEIEFKKPRFCGCWQCSVWSLNRFIRGCVGHS